MNHNQEPRWHSRWLSTEDTLLLLVLLVISVTVAYSLITNTPMFPPGMRFVYVL